MENEIVVNDYNKHAQTYENTTSYKHVNFCGIHRPCGINQIEDEYCIHHRNENTRGWYKVLRDLGKTICATYPFTCELCYEEGHFEFQFSGSNKDIAGDFCDNMITPNQNDELTLFLGYEEISRKTSLLNMSDIDMEDLLHGCYLYCVNNFYARLSGHCKDYLDDCRRALSQVRRLKLDGISLKQFKTMLKIGRMTKVKNQV